MQVLVIEPMDEVYQELLTLFEKSAADIEPIRFKKRNDILEWIKLVEASRLYEEKSNAPDNEADEASSEEGEEEEEGNVEPENQIVALEGKTEDDLIDLESLNVGLIVSNSETMGPENTSLFKKISDYLKAYDLLAEEIDEVKVLFTDRDNNEFNIEPYLRPQYANILLKPFDKTVCLGKINWAIMGIPASGEEQLHKEKPPEPVELLKNVNITKLTELGFTSISLRKIEVGALGKYYLDFLEEGVNPGVFGKCISCEPNPTKKGEFLSRFSFFGARAEEIRMIRKYIESQENAAMMPLPDTAVKEELPEKGAEEKVAISVISEDEILGTRIKDYLSSTFERFEVYMFQNLMDFNLEAIPEMLKGLDDSDEEDDEDSDDGEDVETLDEGVIVFDETGTSYIRTEPEVDVNGMCGLSRTQLTKFRSLCLNSVPESERGMLLEYFKQGISDPLVIAIKDQKETYMLAIDHSEKAEDSAKVEIHIHIRVATPEEAVKYAEEHISPAAKTKILFISDRLGKLLKPRYVRRMKELLAGKGKADEVSVFVAGKGPLPSHIDLLKLTEYTDYFVEPFDPPYMERKIKQAIPSLPSSKPLARNSCQVGLLIKTGVPYELEYISEISFCAHYNRPIDIGRYRFLVLESEAERRREEFLVKCIGSESEKDDNGNEFYKNYFNLYGLGDAQNQFVRLWLNETYQSIALAKEKAEGSGE